MTIQSLNGDTPPRQRLAPDKGEIWGLAGETGCGRSITGLSVSRLVNTRPARYLQGRILFDGQDVLAMDERAMRRLRGRAISMIFQGPATNPNSVLRVGEQIADVAFEIGRHAPEAMGLDARAGSGVRRRAAAKLGVEMFERVGIPDVARRAQDYLYHDVVVLRGGQVVEAAPTQQLFSAPRDDYTRALIAAMPEVAF